VSRVLVIFAHPCEESFSAALHGRVVAALVATGWQVDDCDLNAEGFNPVLTAAERRGYHAVATNRAPVQGYVDRLMAAEALVFVYPVWNFGMPAILKGFFDRVFLPGVSFRLENGLVAPNLGHIRKIAVVTTYGATLWRAFLAGDPPRRFMARTMRYLARPERFRYLALNDMNRATQAQRDGFMARVTREMEQF